MYLVRKVLVRCDRRLALTVLLSGLALSANAVGCSSGPEDVAVQSDPHAQVTRSALAAGDNADRYLQDCYNLGVPSPPAWGPVNHGGWTDVGHEDNSLVNNVGGEVYIYIRGTVSPRGICLLTTRPQSSTTTLIDIICQGQNGLSCFYEGVEGTIPSTQFFPNDSVKGGTDLGTVCTNCHAGENAFIAHNGMGDALDLNGTSQWMPAAWVNPYVPASWPMNPGPETFVGYPPSGSTGTPGASTPCMTCHTSGPGGRFPQVETPGFAGNYCRILATVANRPGNLGGMPPNNTCIPNSSCAAQRDPFTQALLSHCGQ